MNDVVTYSYARQNLAKLMDEAERDSAPIFITRQRRRRAAVLLSKKEWDSIQETMYLLGSPKNAKMLREAIAEIEAGKGVERDLIRPARRGKRA